MEPRWNLDGRSTNLPDRVIVERYERTPLRTPRRSTRVHRVDGDDVSFASFAARVT